ncbi:MAG: carbonic anhydrase family protein [Pseudomonadota bacterium]|nr:carbonic anhydrase family protein [Pseudomonadota bacterium]
MIRPVLIAVALWLWLPPALAAGAPWTYAGERGAAQWATLDAGYALCEAGRNQSPVDLGAATAAALAPLELDYRAGGEVVRHDGHTLRIDLPAGDTLRLDGRLFTLRQVHFHTPAEHRLDGRDYPLEAHLVHTGPAGELAVVGVLFEPGASNPALAAFGEPLPASAGASRPLAEPLPLMTLLPDALDYYRYSGSLTTPPCSEGVRWIVLRRPVTASPTQLAALRQALGESNRPLQPLNARLVLE